MNENLIEKYLREQIEENELGYCRKFISPSNRGVPDRLCILLGSIKEFVECKSATGSKSLFQEREFKRYRKYGHRVYLINSKEKVDVFILKMKEKIMTKFFKYWRKVQKTTGVNEKKIILKNFLRDFPILQDVFYYTYNPHLNFGIRKISLKGRGKLFLNKKVFYLLEDLDSKVYTGNKARQELLKLEELLDRPSCNIVNLILRGDLRLGINVTIINSLTEIGIIPTFKVMKAQNVEWKRVKYPCLASVKKDGVRGVIINGKVLSRLGKEFKGLNHIIEELTENIYYNPKMKLDGELLIPGEKFDRASGKIRSEYNTPKAEFWAFDIMNTNWSFKRRLERLEKLQSNHVKLIPHYKVKSEDHAKGLYQMCLDNEDEGIVIKPMNYKYEKKRSYSWLKVKQSLSFDLYVKGFFKGTGKYSKTTGGIIVDYKGNDVRVFGFSDEMRDEIWNNKSKFLNKVVEVKCQQLTEKGSLRHPRFLRWREDK